MKRREFVTTTAKAGIALSALSLFNCNTAIDKKDKKALSNEEKSLFFKISLAQWSLNRSLHENMIDNLDFASIASRMGCEGLEYVNSFFQDKAKDMEYLKEMNTRANVNGVQNVLIMIDNEGNLADFDTSRRTQAIENHYKWIEAAHFLGCHAIRVNLGGGKDRDDAIKASIDSLSRLSDYSFDSGVNILVENHGGFSSDGNWMKSVFSQVTNRNCGTLPDFGNFCVEYGTEKCEKEYDRYQGMADLLPYAKAVSAKSYGFDENGDETTIDYYRIMKMVKESGYTGFIGIEFEGSGSEMKGIELTRDLLIKVGKQL
jgi:sugar phosphate isomerase/epimerase